jgi:hypothetical protein
MSQQSALMLGAILVVSGPTVVGPLLSFVRPPDRLQRILLWEGSLIDPVGAILGAVLFAAVVAGTRFGHGGVLAEFVASVGVGLAGGVVGTALLWLLLGVMRLGEALGTMAQLAVVIAMAAACDMIRADTGLIAAIVMGLAAANMRGFDIPARRPFLETLVSLIIGLLFIAISASVSPDSLRHVVLPTVGLTLVLVLVARPLVAFLATLGTDLTRGERLFVGWMAPRGIVAAATASAFSTTLVEMGVGGASKILPVTFLVIVATVTLYGLTAAPVGRRLGVTRPSRARPLLVGGERWVVDVGHALRSAGLEVLMWAGPEDQRERIKKAGLELAPGELVAAATGGRRMEGGVTAVLLLTEEDDFNALAAVILADNVDGPVYRLGHPPSSRGVVAPYLGGEILFGAGLSRSAVASRARAGAKIITRGADGSTPAGHDLLFLVHSDGRLEPATSANRPLPQAGDTLVLLGPGPVDTEQAPPRNVGGNDITQAE